MHLKIGLVTGEFPPQEGGVGAFTQALAQALHHQGHEVHIITSIDARPPIKTEKTYTNPNSPLELWRRLEDRAREPLSLGYAKLHPRARVWRWRENRLVVDIAMRYGLDVVNIQYQAAAFNMRHPAINLLPWRLRGVTLPVVTFHDLRVPYLFPKAGGLRPWIIRLMAQKAGGVITTNSGDAETVRGWLGQGAERQVVEIPIGSNIRTYIPNPIEKSEAQESLGLAPNDFLLAYFGFLNPTKGADVLVKALAGLEADTHLVFIGGRTGASDSQTNSQFWQTLEKLIMAFGLERRVHWTGFVSDVRVSTFLHTADVLVLPYKDGVSLRRGTLMAGLAHGRAIISTTPTHPIPELRHGENIWLVPPDDVVALSEAISQLRADAALRQRLGQGAAQLAHQFGWDKIAADSTQFYRQLLEHRTANTRYYD
jgi:glycosyltransferase involved in cell wall biosynthesis